MTFVDTYCENVTELVFYYCTDFYNSILSLLLILAMDLRMRSEGMRLSC